ncbi:hypothetical protein L1077_07645 [Pseudoalteromonas luteoviolacea]|uniref:DoxX family protein n=1 Tax=Pseudoalteromonas luteoviolacea TaxID=43657 RepID=UPI001F166782|nr:hypothetical protein [Pseudoalteromonas luteoviolacea]MCF6439298.1 hypothetical protein [Pseudoalteromonas luteoviolacea]
MDARSLVCIPEVVNCYQAHTYIELAMVTPIIILFLLIMPLCIAHIIARSKGGVVDVKKFACWGLGLAYLFFFIGHIVKAQGMVEMLPPWVPYRLALVYLTGLLELIVGIALFIPKFQVLAAKVAIAMFVAFFPANVYAAINSIGLGGHQWGPIYLLIRGPLQLILISWAYFLCIRGLSIRTLALN